MPFDAAGFQPTPPRRKPPPSDNFVTGLIILLASLMLGLPLSLAALIDIVHYLRGP